MSYRNASGKNEKAHSDLIFSRLLKINKLREARLHRQKAIFDKQQYALRSEMQRCRSRLAEVTLRLKVLLNWQGTSATQALMEKKRKMAALFSQGQKLLAQQWQLQDHQQQLENKRSEIQKGLILLIKKNEKIARVLADERHQS